MVEQTIANIVNELKKYDFIKGIVLGGSRATGTATANSDIDIGIYYEKGKIDYDKLNFTAQQLDDSHRENLICKEGEWGNWVNCGGWLVVNGFHVDFILRDITRVNECIKQTDKGDITMHYQTGHPHAYLNVMYRGELASCKVFYSKDDNFLKLKEHAECYADSLKRALIDFFSFEAKFSCNLAKSYSQNNDMYYIIGHLFRSISAINQVLFAINQTYCLNEKKAAMQIERLAIHPQNYCNRINQILTLSPDNCLMQISKLEQLCHEVEKLADKALNTKYKKERLRER